MAGWLRAISGTSSSASVGSRAEFIRRDSYGIEDDDAEGRPDSPMVCDASGCYHRLEDSPENSPAKSSGSGTQRQDSPENPPAKSSGWGAIASKFSSKAPALGSASEVLQRTGTSASEAFQALPSSAAQSWPKLMAAKMSEGKDFEWRFGDGGKMQKWNVGAWSHGVSFAVGIEQLRKELKIRDRPVCLKVPPGGFQQERYFPDIQAAIDFLENIRTSPSNNASVAPVSLASKDCEWRYGDSWSTLAKFNPGRWSDALSFAEAKDQLRKELKVKDRPIALKVPPGPTKSEQVFETIQAALDFLAEAERDSRVTTQDPPLPLKIKILGAKGLPKPDMTHLLDCYCSCQIEGEPQTMKKTEVVYSTLNPIWTFKDKLERICEEDKVEFKIWSVRAGGTDECLGTVTIGSEVFGKEELTLPIPEVAKGELKVKVKVMSLWEKKTGMSLQTTKFKEITEGKTKMKQKLMAQVLDAAFPQAKKILDGVEESMINSLTDDPHMSKEWREKFSSWVSILWADVMVEIEDVWQEQRTSGVGNSKSRQLRHQRLGQLGAAEKGSGLARSCHFYTKARNYILYHFLAYDLSIFGKFADLAYWPMMLLTALPLVRVFFFATILLFFVMKPFGRWTTPDEFQLVQYILFFKGTQWLATGVVLAVSGAAQYYICVQNDTCETNAPGVSFGVTIPALDAIGCSMLVWTSFLLLPHSQKTAGLRCKEKDSEEGRSSLRLSRVMEENDSPTSIFSMSLSPFASKRSNTKASGQRQRLRFVENVQIYEGRGGRMKGLLYYDIKCFVCSLIFLLSLVIWGLTLHPTTFEPGSALYWTRCFYAFSAFPFMAFNIPGLQSVLTHTKPTGWNRHGEVVPCVLPPTDFDDDADSDQEPGTASI